MREAIEKSGFTHVRAAHDGYQRQARAGRGRGHYGFVVLRQGNSPTAVRSGERFSKRATRGIGYPCTLYCLLVPDAPHAVEVEGPVASEDRDSKVERLGDQQPVEGVAVMERQTAAADGL